MIPRVLVMLGTYNGEKYVSEQIDSILSQEGVLTHLLIRDDASNDSTPSILSDYKMRYPERIQLILGDVNLFPHNYEEIAKNVDIEEFDYFAISDHDDVWMKEKLQVAIDMLHTLPDDKPSLYYSNLAVTDEKLNFRFNAYEKGKIASTPESCFVDIAASANTFVFNKLTMDIYQNGPIKDGFFGDVWLQLVVFFVGNVVYDDVPHLLFRRTGNNVSGAREKGIFLWISRIKRIKTEKESNTHMHSEMASFLLECYADRIDEDKKYILKAISNYNKSFTDKIRLLFSNKIKSLSHARNITFKGRILLDLL